MSQTTLIGVVADSLGLVSTLEVRQRYWAPELTREHFALPSLDYRARQDRVPLTVGHGGPVIGRFPAYRNRS